MITRRTILGTGAGVVVVGGVLAGAAGLGRLDELADAVGIEPKPRPDDRDEALVRAAAAEHATLAALAHATSVRHDSLVTALKPYVTVLDEQLAALGGATETDLPTVSDSADEAITALSSLCGTTAQARATDALEAITVELAQVLTAVSAGLAQCALGIETLR